MPTTEYLLDLLTRILPYIEDAEGDPVYKPGAVRRLTQEIRAAIGETE